MMTKTKVVSSLDTVIARLERSKQRVQARRSGLQNVLKVTADDSAAGTDDPMPAADERRVILETVIAAIDEGISIDDLRSLVADELALLDAGTAAEKMAGGRVLGVKVNPSRSPYSQSKAARTTPAHPVYGVKVDKSRSPFGRK